MSLSRLRRRIKDVQKKFQLLWRFAQNARNRRMSIAYIRHWRKSPIQAKTILYEAFAGRGLVDNPKALFEAMMGDKDFADWTHIWVLDDFANHRATLAQYASVPNVRFVQFGSKAYMRAVATSQVLVNNVTFYKFFVKRPGQTYINPWHGIPLKHLGVRTDRLKVINVLRNFCHVDYLISACPFLTEVYERDFQLGSRFGGEILEAGYPRLDTLVQTRRDEVLSRLIGGGVAIDPGRKIILYAPTWREVGYAKPDTAIEPLLAVKEALEAAVDTTRYQVLVKPHQLVYHAARKRLDALAWMVPATIDANALLAITDVLVSDYSSIFYDFLWTRRPVLFYIPDLAAYATSRGLYAQPESLPGPVCETLEALTEAIRDPEAAMAPYAERYEAQRHFAGCDVPVGEISRRVMRHILLGEPAPVAKRPPRKTSIAFFVDVMRINGIINSLLNLLQALDYDRYDVTLFTSQDARKDLQRLAPRLPPQVRLLYREYVYGRTFTDECRLNYYSHRGFRTERSRKTCPMAYFEEEVLRYLGPAPFDCVIDFVGYSLFFATLALATKASRRLIWAHSDMKAEQRLRLIWLARVFSLYSQFDALVSCSESLCEQNRQNFSDFRWGPIIFEACRNVVDRQRVETGLATANIFSVDGADYLAEGELGERVTTLKAIPLSHQTESGEWTRPKRFVMIGRLSPEKNYTETFKAFALFVSEHPQAVLYVVGEGPQEETLKALIASLQMERHIFLIGRMENPARLLAQCDCFLLTSLHEGQPMVVLEARIARLPILLAKFSSYESACIENGQYLVETDQASILEGLRAFVEGRVPIAPFDAEAYNRTVLSTFDRLLVTPETSESAKVS